jgi:hypothetical protein
LRAMAEYTHFLVCQKAAFLLVGLLLLSGLPGTAEAKLVKDPARQAGSGPEAVFSAIARAWEMEDEAALADLVHEDGLRVTSGDYDRYINYSPSQAYYYFKNQFQAHPTVSFTFERQQEKLSGEKRVHGMVVWKYRSATAAAQVQEMKLVLVLTRQAEVWRLSEINTINMK